MSRLQKIVVPLAVVLVTVAGIWGLSASKPEPESKPEVPRPRTVYVESVQESVRQLTVTSQGEVKARTEIDLIAEVSGKVVYVSPEFTEGGVFTPGLVLLRIEDSDYQVALANAKAELARQQVQVDQGLADAEVARQQLAGVKASALGLKKPQLAEAQAGLAAARARLQQAEIDLARTQVALPYSGRVRAEAVGLGQYVTQGTPLAKVFADDVVEVRLPLTDSQLASLGLPIGYTAPLGDGPSVALSAKVMGFTRYWQGHLVRVDSAFDPLTRVIYAMVQVPNPYSEETLQASGSPLAVGLFVDAEIGGQQLANARSIPREALRAGNRVFVVKDGALDIRVVDVQHTDNDTAVIRAGLAVGEQVVVSPVRDPINGLKVEALAPQGFAGPDTSVSPAATARGDRS
ncbi:efflux RND transporter periplasmic adaptor subunit [Halioxenophilus sp. WMMB6]|uniref:efflux RND transporter periplasmic adaptor subunit n=1 Tax=Halioxenophilus sp. WMMB6 TaxID=3073815 RepID=UPI00295E6CDA|nr:efflux RND transporter periplasmic adaptor subunit [Halioxenophilus sp. WMMB6]